LKGYGMETKKLKILGVLVLVIVLLLWGFTHRLRAQKEVLNHSDRLVILAPAKNVVAAPLWLTDDTTLSDATFKGHWSLVYFGFTRCPDICPTTLSALSRAYIHLAKEGLADQVKIYFVTVDPKRDDKAVLIEYLKSFNPKFIGVTGTASRLDFFQKQFGVFAQEDKDSFNHSEAVLVINPEGLLSSMLVPPHFEADLAKDITYLLKSETHPN
jgi:protein SCO1